MLSQNCNFFDDGPFKLTPIPEHQCDTVMLDATDELGGLPDHFHPARLNDLFGFPAGNVRKNLGGG